VIYLSHHQLPELANLSPLERRTALVNFRLTDGAASRRSRLLGYVIFGGQISGIIVGAVFFPDSPEKGILLSMLGGLFLSLAVGYFVDLYSSRPALRAFIAASSRPFVPVNDCAAILIYRGKQPQV
jgi:hypothetical protein